MIELNCETDFVARNERFQVYAQKVLDIAHAGRVRSKDELLGLSAEDGTFVSDMIVQMISVFRENIVLSRLTFELAQDNEVVGCLTVSVWPFSAAKCSGVCPYSFFALTSAPFSTSKLKFIFVVKQMIAEENL